MKCVILMTKLDRILLVESDRAYATAALRHLPTSASMHATRDYVNAVDLLRTYTDGDAAIIDCFFPFQVGSNDFRMGLDATYKMMFERNPLMERIEQVVTRSSDLSSYLVKKMLRIAGRNHQGRDGYAAFEKAMLASENNQPLGILAAEEAQLLNIPFVLTTSRHRGDDLTQPVYAYSASKGWTVVDCDPQKEGEKATPAYWSRVFDELSEVIARHDVTSGKEANLI